VLTNVPETPVNISLILIRNKQGHYLF